VVLAKAAANSRDRETGKTCPEIRAVEAFFGNDGLDFAWWQGNALNEGLVRRCPLLLTSCLYGDADTDLVPPALVVPPHILLYTGCVVL
jgi:hypothetical protein